MGFDFDEIDDMPIEREEEDDSKKENELDEGDMPLQEIDERIRTRLTMPVVGKLPEGTWPDSPWLPFGTDPGKAVVRLFCFFGIGKQAQQFVPWTKFGKEHFPMVQVCPVELPGKGSHKKLQKGEQIIFDAHVFAEEFRKNVLLRLAADGLPFAILGYSLGARMAYEVARRFPSSCLRVYVAARAAPEVGARGTGDDRVVILDRADPAATLRWSANTFGDETNRKFMEDVIKMSKEKDDPIAYLQTFSDPIQSDYEIQSTEVRDVDLDGELLPKRLQCRLNVYESADDEVWPPSVIQDTWKKYAPANGAGSKKHTYKGLRHDQVCATKPLLEDVCTDLVKLLRKKQ